MKLYISIIVVTIILPKCLSSKPARIFIAEQSKEEKILDLLSKLGTEDDFDHVSKPFPYNDPSLYINQEALSNFTTNYNEGFLDRTDVFLPYDSKTYRDTASLRDILYFAKDFDVFRKIASWAKNEINPVQYFYALISAVLHRSDLSYIKIPPIYEILPNYFVPSSVMNAAYRARLNGVDYRKFVLNNTGWEIGNKFHYSYNTILGKDHKLDYEARLSYYREDVSRSDFFFKYFKKLDISMNDKIKYGQTYERLEEWYYTAFKWILTRYNLERYAVDLPPVQPLYFHQSMSIVGYDSQLSDLYGRHFSSRPDDMKFAYVNPQGSFMIETFLNIYLAGFYKSHSKTISDTKKSKKLSNLFKKTLTEDKSNLQPLYFGLMEQVDRLSLTFNKKFTQGVLLNDLTRMRDPAYYQILALVDKFVRAIEVESKPYSKQELGFPGVEITDITIGKLKTYFEYFDFDISNVVPGMNGKFMASQYRINHEPFSVKINVRSDADSVGIVKIFMGPETDVLNRSLNLNELRESFTLMDTFEVELEKGNNIIERRPSQSELTSQPLHFEDIKRKSNDDPRTSQLHCYYPSHLMLPKGSSYGKPFKLFFIIYPSEKRVATKKGCGREHLTLDITRTLPFPVDRYWEPTPLEQNNMKFVNTFIYHKD